MTNSKTPSVSPKAHMDKVQEAFIAEVQENGLAHVLRWSDAWFGRAAAAEVRDTMENSLGEHIKNPEAVELHLLDRLFNDSGSANNFSTSAGHNLYRAAMIAARTEELNSLYPAKAGGTPTPASRAGRQARWEAVHEANKSASQA